MSRRNSIGATLGRVGRTHLLLLLLWSWVGAWLAGATGYAHNPDTSYVRCRLEPNGILTRFIYDPFTLERMVRADANRDGMLAREELQRATAAIVDFLQKHVRLTVDGSETGLGLPSAAVWPEKGGEAIPQSEWHSADALVSVSFRRALEHPAREVLLEFNVFDDLGPRHVVLGTFELGGKAEEVTFTQTEPDFLFDAAFAASMLTTPSTASTVSGAPSVGGPAEAGAAPAKPRGGTWAGLFRFFRLGMEHIFLGIDHLCFLLALLVVSRVRMMIQTVTAFSVAHSITLILAVLDVVSLPTRWIECAIALTIVYVAAENLWRKEPGHRWMLTFGFGLIHGFSFANTLKGLGLPTGATIRCLLAFNVGVEVAQLIVALALLPLIWQLLRWRHGARLIWVGNAGLVLIGLLWFAERAFLSR